MKRNFRTPKRVLKRMDPSNTGPRLAPLLLLAALFAIFLTPMASRGVDSTLWSLGNVDDTPYEFGDSNLPSTPSPGSPYVSDDDYYFAGSYTAPIGTLEDNESLDHFPRTLSMWDPTVRIHFMLSADQALSTTQFRFSTRVIWGGWWDPVLNKNASTFGTNEITYSLNGALVQVHKDIQTTSNLIETFRFPTNLVLKAGPQTFEIRRSNGTTNGWFAFDHLQLEINPTAWVDADGDGLPEFWEEDHNTSDHNAQDALIDRDQDGLNELQEFHAGTDPLRADTDSDGLKDGEEVAALTNPLIADTDGDRLSDGDEIRRTHTNPLDPDTDHDGYGDGLEAGLGSDPLQAQIIPLLFKGGIGIQFVSEMHPVSGLHTNDAVGVVRQAYWNRTIPLNPWSSVTGNVSNIESPRPGRIVDGSGKLQNVQTRWSSVGTLATENTGDDQRKILDGFIAGNTNDPVDLQLTGIPFAQYDLLLYVGGMYPGSRGMVRLNDSASTDRYFVASTLTASEGFRPIESTIPTFHRGNYVRYRNLSSATARIQIFTTDYSVGLHAIQIIDPKIDSDSDGMPDAWELEYALNPLKADGSDDLDHDGLTNLEEFQRNSDPQRIDTDGDGLSDFVETGTGVYVSTTNTGTKPNQMDSDGDGLPDGSELLSGPDFSNPNLTDTDGDGFPDEEERERRSNPSDASLKPDTVPAYKASPREWNWVVDQVQLSWDHRIAGAFADPYYYRSFASFQVYNASAETGYPDLEIALRFSQGKLSWLFRSTESGAFAQSSDGSGIWNSDFSSPPRDLTRELGFSGIGTNDLSDRLQFSLKAQRQSGTPNRWTLVYEIYNLDANRSVVRQTFPAMVAYAALESGKAQWTAENQKTNRVWITSASGVHIYRGTNRLKLSLPDQLRDSDNDGLPDAWETQYGLNPANSGDANTDLDKDGLTQAQEYLLGTNPNRPDTDGDGASDGYEVAQGTDPLNSRSYPAFFHSAPQRPGEDLDGNGLSDAWETWAGAQGFLANADDDGDGFTNLAESLAGTHPLKPESNPGLTLESHHQPDTGQSEIQLSWQYVPLHQYSLSTSTNLELWTAIPAFTPRFEGAYAIHSLDAEASQPGGRFFTLNALPIDSDQDGISDAVEQQLGSDPKRPNSTGGAVQVDDNNDGIVDRTLPGDWVHYAGRLNARINPSSGSISNQMTQAEAARFLTQATFGPTLNEIERLRSMTLSGWIDEQQALPPYLFEPYIKDAYADLFGPRRFRNSYNASQDGDFLFGNNILTTFARGAIHQPDQLRQRMAFALSQILVVSRRDSGIQDMVRGLANYYDIFLRNSFGSYHDILREVALHPIMGRYLSHVGNQKARPEINQYPDENFAREIMQLFSIGLWELNPNGTRKLDAQGNPIPTYSNLEITQLARVFTGLWYGGRDFGYGGYSDDEYCIPMSMHAEKHDFGRKTLTRGYVIPVRAATDANGMRDVEDAIRHLFEHPSTPPFICKQLIQFFITFNPSPEYVERVQNVFVNNGRGVRGDLGAVLRAILLDPEARTPAPLLSIDSFGKLKEPVIRTMQLARILKIGQTSEDFVWWSWGEFYNDAFQEPLYSPTVFNFYRPDYRPPGEITSRGLVAPVFRITDSYSSISLPNRLWQIVESGFTQYDNYQFGPDYSELLRVAAQPDALVDLVNLLFCQGAMNASARDVIKQAISTVPANQASARVRIAAGLALLSPDGAIQH